VDIPTPDRWDPHTSFSHSHIPSVRSDPLGLASSTLILRLQPPNGRQLELEPTILEAMALAAIGLLRFSFCAALLAYLVTSNRGLYPPTPDSASLTHRGREGSDVSEGSGRGAVDVNIVGPSDEGEVSVMPKSTPPPPDAGAISGEVTSPPGGTNPTLTPTNSSPSHHRFSPSQDQTQAIRPLIKTISSSSARSTSGAATAAPPRVLGFIPNFKGAAEMEDRRKVWLQARRSFGMGTGGAQPAQPLSPGDFDSSASASEPEPHGDIEGDQAQTSDEDIHECFPVDSGSDALVAGEDSAEEDGFDGACD
jgi:hypothetical protein